MATTLNRVTIGNDFILKVKVGMIQYSSTDIRWDYINLNTCRNITFNITCKKHDIDINLPFNIDNEDPAIISATIRAELLHANAIYNFTISGIDEDGYRWTYISPKQQSFITTDISQDSANAYTELAFTAGMIYPMGAAGKNGYTPYIGDNNHWWINGEDTGISAVAEVDLTNYYTKSETDEAISDAIENIDIHETDLTNYYTKSETDEAISDAIENIDIPETDLTNYYTKSETDEAISDAIENIDLPDIDTSDFVEKDDIFYGNYVDGDYADLDTGVVLSDTLRFVVDYQKYGLATSFLENRPLISGFSNDIMYFAFGSQDNEAMRVYYIDTFDYYVPNTGTDFNRHTIEWSLRGGLYFDNEHLAEGTQSSIVDRITNDGNTIPNIYFHRNETNHIALYNVKIYDGDTLLRDYEPVTTENGNGYHDKVNDTYLLSNNLNYYDYYRFPEIKQYNKALNDINNRINNIDLWNPVNEIYSYYDCTEAIDKILNNDTITIGVDIQSLWECAFNHDLRKAIPVYKNSPVSWYVDRDENNQILKTYYRFWNRDDGLYYNVTVQWYYSYDGGEILWGNIVSTSYSTTEYATKGYVDNAIQNIPGGSTPDLSNYVTTSFLNSNYYDKQTSDNKVLESPINNTPAQYIPHSTIKFLGTTDRIKIYDIFKWELNGMAIRSSNGFKVGILYNEEEFQYKSLSDLTYDNHVNINIWWKTITTEGNTSYEYFDTTFELTTANNNISFNLVEQGDDMLGHYIIVDIEGAYFGAVETVSDITTYTGSEDTTGITINQSAGTAGVYDPATLKVTVLSKYYQNNANATILTIIPYLKNYALKSEIPSIQTMTQAQYDELVADNEISSNTLYIIL